VGVPVAGAAGQALAFDEALGLGLFAAGLERGGDEVLALGSAWAVAQKAPMDKASAVFMVCFKCKAPFLFF
jgi:hypothetical protein